MTNETIIETTNLTKIYGRRKVVDSVNLSIKRGSIYGLIGRNGAGKTTILKMIAGTAAPSFGTVTLSSDENETYSLKRKSMGTLIEDPGLFYEMSAFDNLKMKAIALGCYDKNEINEILSLIGLSNTGKKKAGKFSLGMRQRLGIGLALVGNPKTLILDEPINGLDPQGIVEIRELLLKLNNEKGITILISSHILSELSRLVSHYGIIDHGCILEELTADELMNKCSTRLEIATDNPSLTAEVLKEKGYVNFEICENNRIRIYERLEEAASLNKLLVEKGIMVSHLAVNSTDVENYFLDITGKGGLKNA